MKEALALLCLSGFLCLPIPAQEGAAGPLPRLHPESVEKGAALEGQVSGASPPLHSLDGRPAEEGEAQAWRRSIADKVIISPSLEAAEAVRDLMEDRSDVLLTALSMESLERAGPEGRELLLARPRPELFWSLLINPIPDKAPYTWTDRRGQTSFNPLAVREFRFALNRLIDRQRLADELLGGAGAPMITMAQPGQPEAEAFDRVAQKLGLSASGDEGRALAAMEEALLAAARLPENAGRLVKLGSAWQYLGEPVTVTLVSRLDDPSGLLPAGRYIARQIEKAGIQVRRLELDRVKAARLAAEDPAELGWHIYTERWGFEADGRLELTAAQMYAPFYGELPGGSDPRHWAYRNGELDSLLLPLARGAIPSATGYWDALFGAAETGLRESVRVFLASTTRVYLANRGRLPSPPLFESGSGSPGWALRSAAPRPDASGERTLRAAVLSSSGALFRSPWNPISTSGFLEGGAQALVAGVSDAARYRDPRTGATLSLRAVIDAGGFESEAELKNGVPADGLPVPPEALRYDPKTKTWESVGTGLRASAKALVSPLFGTWHSGQAESLADLAYAEAFIAEWSSKDGPDDRRYDEGFAAEQAARRSAVRGIRWDWEAGRAAVWAEAWYPPDPLRVFPLPDSSLAAFDYGLALPWEIYEAIDRIVAEGSKSKTAYSVSSDYLRKEVDLKDPGFVSELSHALEDLAERRHVPACLREWLKPEEAVARYRASAAFIARYGHGLISNGPFFLSRIDLRSQRIELSAWREGYPYSPGYWPAALSGTPPYRRP